MICSDQRKPEFEVNSVSFMVCQVHRSPKIARPTRTEVAPSSTTASYAVSLLNPHAPWWHPAEAAHAMAAPC